MHADVSHYLANVYSYGRHEQSSVCKKQQTDHFTFIRPYLLLTEIISGARSNRPGVTVDAVIDRSAVRSSVLFLECTERR